MKLLHTTMLSAIFLVSTLATAGEYSLVINNGRVIDPRAMFRDSLRTGGDLLLPSFRKKREIHPPLVVLADISHKSTGNRDFSVLTSPINK